ncbi:MAG: cupin domain-containing protein [Armatimonadetes bacterium]|nr:cupin domain-containing protein [Armatimonadota bacterium]
MGCDEKLVFVEEADVETQVFDWGRLSWLSEPRVTAAERFSAGVVKLEPGGGHDRHNHPGVEEILYVISGKGWQVVDAPSGRQEREIGPGVLVHIPPDVYHSTVNTGERTMAILAIYAPPGPEAELRAMPGVIIEPPQR